MEEARGNLVVEMKRGLASWIGGGSGEVEGDALQTSGGAR
jgi:hypothetical protein